MVGWEVIDLPRAGRRHVARLVPRFPGSAPASTAPSRPATAADGNL